VDSSAEFLDVKAVSVRYSNGTQALRTTNLSIRKDQMTVLLGPSGAGKSTLLRVLNGLVKPTSGAITIDGDDCLKDSKNLREHRKQTGMIFQNHQLIPRHSALKNVLLGRLGYKSLFQSLLPPTRQEQIDALACLDKVGLIEKALERCDALSGGQQQRVGIARALVQVPRLILADEPVASLDPASAERVLGTLKTICEQDHIPTVISLHQLDYARAFADRIIGLCDGRVVFDGPVAALTKDAVDHIYRNTSSQTPKDRANFTAVVPATAT
jgi:phosphonate transport system ATP-binding protein